MPYDYDEYERNIKKLQEIITDMGRTQRLNQRRPVEIIRLPEEEQPADDR